ncbi:hypothetical protein H0A71_14745 [Alcaligenaceae bacterium]|nr:hypothetical protein [Alcaligenaceae bacterium]
MSPVANTLKVQGIVVAVDRTPDGLRTFIDAEVNKWKTVIETAGITLD